MTLRNHRSKLAIFALLALVGGMLAACDTSTSETEPAGMTPFAISARIEGATVEEITEALTSFIHNTDDTEAGLPADWIVAGGNELEDGADPIEAALRLPGGTRIVEVCNHHYASMAMSFGGHHGVALPCEISVHQDGDAVEVVILEPEAIFSVFFGDVPAEHQESMGGLAAAVRAELVDLIELSLAGFDASYPDTPVGPVWDDEMVAGYSQQPNALVQDIAIPVDERGSDESAKAFRDAFVAELLTVLTHEHMDEVGSMVEGLSVDDWRSARTYALHLPGDVTVVEVCSPTYAGAALSTGAYHAPALPCQIAIWVEGDHVRVHLLDPMFIFPVFFADAPAEMMESMGGLAAAVAQDLQLIVAAAQDRM